MPIAIMVHGGAKTVAPEELVANEAGCRAALAAGWEILERGGSALDAVEAAIRVLEHEPVFNAGIGASLNHEGQVELDAAMMEGTKLRWGAVGSVQGVRHPITLARRILENEPHLIVGAGATRFAIEQGIELCDPAELITVEQLETWKEKIAEEQPEIATTDTVGCVAMDAEGVLVAATSTGGLELSPAGRVGDSPLLGCGLYADADRGACAVTGDGEAIITMMLAKTALDLLAAHAADAAAEQAIAAFKRRVPGEAGLILLDREGRIGWAHNSSDMPCAYRTADMAEPAYFVRKQKARTRG